MSRQIDDMMFEVCGPCQKSCVFCAHDGMMSAYHNYQLSIEELQCFIDCTRRSDYFIKDLHINGIGEPLLWRHFNEGIILLKKSGVVGEIDVTTNGLLLNRIKDETWECIRCLRVSRYPDYDQQGLLNEKINKYKNKILIKNANGPYFLPPPLKVYQGKIPCSCLSSGPMFVKDKIFFYCGPTVFDAARLSRVDLAGRKDLFTEIKPNYLEGIDETKTGNMDICNACMANSNIMRRSYRYMHKPSRLRLALESWAMNDVLGFIEKKLPWLYERIKPKLNPVRRGHVHKTKK